jgi:hypothetical protein
MVCDCAKLLSVKLHLHWIKLQLWHCQNARDLYLCEATTNWTYLICCHITPRAKESEALAIGNCDIDFFNFSHCQVQNIKIFNLFEWNWTFAVYFWKYNRVYRNWMKAKYYTINFYEISLVLWNLVNFCKILQFLIKFSESPKDKRFKKNIVKMTCKNNQILS